MANKKKASRIDKDFAVWDTRSGNHADRLCRHRTVQKLDSGRCMRGFCIRKCHAKQPSKSMDVDMASAWVGADRLADITGRRLKRLIIQEYP